jgi:hypothetical protein
LRELSSPVKTAKDPGKGKGRGNGEGTGAGGLSSTTAPVIRRSNPLGEVLSGTGPADQSSFLRFMKALRSNPRVLKKERRSMESHRTDE